MRDFFLLPFILCFCGVFLIDQAIKWFFLLSEYTFEGSVISLILVFNKGVAFSLLAFLQEWLKYLQIVLLVGIFVFLWRHQTILKAHLYPLGIIFGAGASNILDRFIHGGVVDYVYWHYLFNFAIFNFADVMINIGVVIIFYQIFLRKTKSKSR